MLITSLCIFVLSFWRVTLFPVTEKEIKWVSGKWSNCSRMHFVSLVNCIYGMWVRKSKNYVLLQNSDLCDVTQTFIVNEIGLGPTLNLVWTMFKKTGSLIKKKVPWIHLCWWGFIEKFSFISGDELSNSYPTDYSLLHFLLKQIWIRNFKFFPGTTWTEKQYTGT